MQWQHVKGHWPLKAEQFIWKPIESESARNTKASIVKISIWVSSRYRIITPLFARTSSVIDCRAMLIFLILFLGPFFRLDHDKDYNSELRLRHGPGMLFPLKIEPPGNWTKCWLLHVVFLRPRQQTLSSTFKSITLIQ